MVLWLEGDDPDCTDDLIGGHIGMDVYFSMTGEDDHSVEGDGDTFNANWDAFWDNLKFWED